MILRYAISSIFMYLMSSFSCSHILIETTEYCERYAKKDNIANPPAEDSSDEDVSDCKSTASSDDVVGQVDP